MELKMIDNLEILRAGMIDFISSTYELDGDVQSEISNLDFFFSKTPTELINIMYEPSLCVILQGHKAVGFGEETLSYNTEEYLVSSTHLPAKMKILEASEDKPYMSLRIKLSKIGTTANKITNVISQIKDKFDEKLNIKELAYSVDMSESSLYQHFKTITTMSQLQFQKNLRLEEARQLLLLKDIEVSEAAYQVGYESPSQFSREFSRMFGISPKSFMKSAS